MRVIFSLLLGLAGLFIVQPAFAHEAYVLTPSEFRQGMQAPPDLLALQALKNPVNLQLTIILTAAVLVGLVLSILFWRSGMGRRLDRKLRRLDRFGPIMVRAAISASLIASALTGSFLGPEISQGNILSGQILEGTLLVIGLMIAAGFLVELAALGAIVVFGLAALSYGWYLATYLNYLGELVVLLLFGSRYLSLDRLIFGAKERLRWLAPYETTIVRVGYGLALTYAAINVKLLHPTLTLAVVNDYHLTQFNWLFPPDPMLVTLGAAMAETAIGIFIILGFQTRLTVLISLFYITLSLLYFKEAVWPHLLLYGISLSLLLNDGGKLTVDEILVHRKDSA